MKLRTLVACALLAVSACGGGDGGTSETTAGAPTATTVTTSATETTTATATTTIAPVSSMVWARVPHDDAVFGGEGDQVMKSVTAGGPGLVAVGWDVSARAAAVWTSPDGIVWSRVPHDEAVFGGDGDQFMSSVTAGGPGLVAVGSDSHVGDIDAAVWTSPDGIVWSRVPDDEAVFSSDDWQPMTSVTVGGPGLVAVGWAGFEDRDGAVWTSADGITWSRVPHDEAVFGGELGEEMFSVAAGGPGLVAVGREGDVFLENRNAAVWTSADGISWSRVPHDEAVFGGEDWQEMVSVAAGGPGLVAVGTDQLTRGGAVWTSADGVAWSRVPHDEEVFRAQAMSSVTAAGPGLVAVGAEFEAVAVWTSADGITWSRVPHDDAVFSRQDQEEMSSVTAAAPGLVAVGRVGPAGSLDAVVWVGEG